MDNNGEFQDKIIFEDIIKMKVRSGHPVKQFGKGILRKCLEKCIKFKLIKQDRLKEEVKIYHSYYTNEVEEFFDNELFDMLCDPDYVDGAELYFVIEEVSELRKITPESIKKNIEGLLMLSIEAKAPSYRIATKMFPNSETGPCYNFETEDWDSEDSNYCKVNIDPDFLKACLEVKHEISLHKIINQY